MKRYYKEIDGTRVWFNGILKTEGKQVINPTEDMILADGWIEYVAPVAPEPSEEVLLERERRQKLREIEAYDQSKSVNVFYIQLGGREEPIAYWVNKHERDSLKSAVRDCIAMGITTYRLDLRDFGISIDIECEVLLQMLTALEVYAIKCYNKTTDHVYAVKSLTTREEIKEYDHTLGYPEKLTFNV